MKYYILYNEDGRILQTGMSSDGLFPEIPGFQALETSELVDSQNYFVEDGDILPIPVKPTDFHILDWSLKQWIPDLSMVRSSYIKSWDAWRDMMLSSGYFYGGHTYYTDDTFLGELQLILKGYERGHITGTSRIRTKEKAVLDLNEEQVEGILLLVGLFRQDVYNQSWTGKDALNDSALTYEQLLTMGPPEL